MRLVRTLLVGLVLLAGTAAAAAWLVPPQLDLDAYRGRIADLASFRLGGGVHIDGRIELRLLPEPILTAAKISVGSAESGVRITAAELRLRVALGPLLAGRVDARELVLRGAELRLPWPFDPAVLRLHRPSWLAGVSARVEDGRLVVGNLAVTGIDGTLVTDAYTGTYTVAGTGHFSNAIWRFAGRLTQPGTDGSAGLDVTLDGQGRVQGVGGTLTGQFAPDGSFAGRLTARGSDLSRLLPAPALPFSAEGRITVAGGLAAADDLALQIGGSPARGAVALRVTPGARLDLALAASRIDLDAWLPVLGRPGLAVLPTGIDLSAEAASLAGGTLRGLRVAVDLLPGGAEVREARAMLPGDAALRLTGRILPAAAGVQGPRFEGDVTLTAPALRTTLDWIAKAGVAPLAALPDGVLHSATLAAHIAADPMQVAISQLNAEIDGSHVLGSLTLRGGRRFAIGAGLSVDRIDLDPWLPPTVPSLPDLPTRFGAFDLNLRLDAKQAVLHGITFAPLALDAGAEGSRLVVRKLDLEMNGVHASASATVAEGGHVTEGRLDLQAPQAAPLAALLPERLAFLGRTAPGLWQAAAAVQVLGSGAPDSLNLKVTADLGDLKLEAQPTLDLTHHTWKAAATLRHPGAPRLLQAFGVTGAPGWLGDGSLSVVAQLSASSDKLAADSFDLTAGQMHATGSLMLNEVGQTPVLAGHIEAETLPLPLPDPRAPEPLPLAMLRGWDGSVRLQAARVLANLRPVMQQASTTLALSDGTLRIEDLTAQLAGGTLALNASIRAAAEPPTAALHITLTDAMVTEPVFDLPIDLSAGKLDADAELTATGHAPAALLATLGGQIQLDATAGTLAGVSLASASGGLSDTQVAAALAGGTTAFDHLRVSARADRGVVTVGPTTFSGPSGSGTIGGTIDLIDQSFNLRIGLRPAVPDAPEIGLRLSGRGETLHRTPELADLIRWRAAQVSSTPPAPQ